VVTNTQDYAHHLKGLSPIGVAAARFAIEKPGLSMPHPNLPRAKTPAVKAECDSSTRVEVAVLVAQTHEA
jgi:hypothetical protein